MHVVNVVVGVISKGFAQNFVVGKPVFIKRGVVKLLHGGVGFLCAAVNEVHEFVLRVVAKLSQHDIGKHAVVVEDHHDFVFFLGDSAAFKVILL